MLIHGRRADLTQRLRSHLTQHAGMGSEAKVDELAGGNHLDSQSPDKKLLRRDKKLHGAKKALRGAKKAPWSKRSSAGPNMQLEGTGAHRWPSGRCLKEGNLAFRKHFKRQSTFQMPFKRLLKG